MHLKLEELQKLVTKVVKEEKRYDSLKEEVSRVVGPVVVTTHDLKLMAETANNHLDVLVRSGKQITPARTSVLLKFIDSGEPEVRRLIARLLPESFVRKMRFDANHAVRWAVAERLPAKIIAEMVKQFPSDDQLRTIYKSKKLYEAGLPSPKLADEEFDINGEKPLGDTAHYDDHPGMTDVWYDSLAREIVTKYGHTIETNWEEKAVDNYANGMKSQGVELDSEKLLDAIYDYLAKREENTLKEGTLRRIAASLRDEDTLDAPFMPVIGEGKDVVNSLLRSQVSPAEYIQQFESTFSVTKASVNNIGRKQGINENFARVIVPVEAILPAGTLRPNDEKALDTYTKSWNRQRQLRNQPYRLSWTPGTRGKVSFQLGLT